jgi:hypothetical protein
MPTAVVALALLAAHLPAKPTALVGSAELPQTYLGPAIPALTSYNFKNYDPANREFFRTAFAPGVVTLTDRFPEDSRPWSPWFLARMRDGNQILTYAEIARLKEAVALFVYHDSRLLWRTNWDPSAFVKALDEVLTDAFKAVKIEEPSNELIQIGMAEAVCQWVQTKQNYRNTSGMVVRLDGLLRINPESTRAFVCDHASHLSYIAVGHWEKFRKKAGRGTGIIAMGLRGQMWGGNGNVGSHAWFGVSIKCADGRRMKIQLDSVPGRRSTPNRRIATQHMGCFSRVGCETVAATRLSPTCL